jgi:hypothetical protein
MEQFEREDRFRLHKERIEAYSAFYAAAGNARPILGSNPSDQSAVDARNEVWLAYTRVLLVGDGTVLDAAGNILRYITAVTSDGRAFDSSHYRELIWQLQATARADITGIDPPFTRVPSTRPQSRETASEPP